VEVGWAVPLWRQLASDMDSADLSEFCVLMYPSVLYAGDIKSHRGAAH
jgi:hypothetical protein